MDDEWFGVVKSSKEKNSKLKRKVISELAGEILWR